MRGKITIETYHQLVNEIPFSVPSPKAPSRNTHQGRLTTLRYVP
jgi:hypothetical protein